MAPTAEQRSGHQCNLEAVIKLAAERQFREVYARVCRRLARQARR